MPIVIGLASCLFAAACRDAAAPLPATKLVFVVQPASVTAGSFISPTLKVEVQDANGVKIVSATSSITLLITPGSGVSTAVLGGTLTQAAVNGVSAFPDLTVAKAGSGFTLTAVAPNTALSSAISAPFTVTAAAPSQMASAGGSVTGPAGTAVSNPPSVLVKDAFGNPVAGIPVTFAVTSGGGSVAGGTQTTNAAGQATVGSWTLGPTAGINTLTATAGALAGNPVAFAATGTVGNFALDFVQSYVNIPDDTALDLTSTWTIEAWVYARNASSGSDQDIVSKWDGVGDASYILQIDATGHLRLVTNNGITQTIVLSKATLPNSQWRHVAATFDGNNTTGTVKLYISGSIDTTVVNALTPMNSTQPLAFGREGNFAGGSYNGVIDEVRLWKVARTGTELASFNTKNLVGNETGLVGYWQFNEGTGDTVLDGTGRGNKGRLGIAVGVDAWDPAWSSVIVAPIP